MIVDKTFSKLRDVFKKIKPEDGLNNDIKEQEFSATKSLSEEPMSQKKLLGEIKSVIVFLKKKIKTINFNKQNLQTFIKPPKIYIIIAVIAQILFFYHSMIFVKNSFVDLIIKIKMGSYKSL